MNRPFNIFYRYIAVHYPLRRIYLQQNKRTIKYILCVVLLSTICTITRFFEKETLTVGDLNKNITEADNNTILLISPTELRLNPTYVKYFNWSRLIIHGLIPFVMLVYLNGLMYQDIKARRQNWDMTYGNGRETTETVVDNFQDNDAPANDASKNLMQKDSIQMTTTYMQQTR